MSEELKILSIGNSFSEDTMEYLPQIAKAVGLKSFKFANLYIGGCSIALHYDNIENNKALYTYHINVGDGWSSVENHKISDAVKSERWDYISIQHGSKDGSRYSSKESYEKLEALVKYVKSLARDGVKIAFNLNWVDDPTSPRAEIVSYSGDQKLMFENTLKVTKEVVLPIKDLAVISPAGVAIQNARTAFSQSLTRDGYHLNKTLGRYIAGLCFFKALTWLDISGIEWAPEGVSDEERKLAIKSAEEAVKVPFCVTPIK